MAYKEITKKEIEDLLPSFDAKKQAIIDVRNPDEVETTGLIPKSFCIPLPNLQTALGNKDEWQKAVKGAEFPEKDAQLIFTCRSGARAAKGAEVAHQLGFTNIYRYAGSANEWFAK